MTAEDTTAQRTPAAMIAHLRRMTKSPSHVVAAAVLARIDAFRSAHEHVISFFTRTIDASPPSFASAVDGAKNPSSWTPTSVQSASSSSSVLPRTVWSSTSPPLGSVSLVSSCEYVAFCAGVGGADSFTCRGVYPRLVNSPRHSSMASMKEFLNPLAPITNAAGSSVNTRR